MKYGYILKQYECGTSIPTIVLGDGTVAMTPATNQDDITSSIIFSLIPEEVCTGSIGEEYQYVDIGESIIKLKPLFDLTFSRPESIDSLISQLSVAREQLINMLSEGETKNE